MTNQRRKWIVSASALTALVAAVGAYVAFLATYGAAGGSTVVADDLRCPSEYPTAEEAAIAFAVFTDKYHKGHPDVTLGDMLEARIHFYVSHHCSEELDRYRQAAAGEADKATMDMIDEAIREAARS